MLKTNKIYLFLCLGFFFMGCDYVQKKEEDSNVVASVGNVKLYKQDVIKSMPKYANPTDSLVFVQSFINKWATNILLLEQAQKNISEEDNARIISLVKNYKESLLINTYKEKLINQQLDTVVLDVEIDSFYNNYKSNFRLTEDIVKIKYLHVSKDFNSLKEARKLFRSDNIEDLELLEQQQLSFESYQFNDSTWVSLENILLKTPFSRYNLLKKTKFIQKEDSLGVYLASVKDVLRRTAFAPKDFIKPRIRQMILHQRKIELIRKIEKIIVQDAVKNKTFQTP